MGRASMKRELAKHIGPAELIKFCRRWPEFTRWIHQEFCLRMRRVRRDGPTRRIEPYSVTIDVPLAHRHLFNGTPRSRRGSRLDLAVSGEFLVSPQTNEFKLESLVLRGRGSPRARGSVTVVTV